MNSSDERLASLRRAIERAPDDVDLRAMYAERLLELDRADEAAEAFRQALTRAGGREDLTLGLVRALEASGREDDALSVLDAHVRIGPSSATAQVKLARSLLAAGRESEAAARYAKAVDAEPEVADPFLARRLGISAERERIRAGDAPDSGEGPIVETERPKITFRDVGGMDAVKEQVRLKIIHPLRNPELYRQFGKAVGGGILLYGPPGCGKTHLARATAGEVDAAFIAVGIHDVLEMWIGQSERNLHAFFEEARRRKPAVLFFDEIDGLGASRTDMRASAGRQTINQLLSELDGIGAANEGLLMLAATNAPWHLDPALRRPGRFDRVIFVPPPDAPARAAIVEILLRGKPVADVDVGAVAKKTDGFSGADLRAVVDVAVEAKLQQAMRDGAPTPIRTADLLGALRSVRPSTKEWFATARNYVLYANQAGHYDDVRAWLDLD